MRDRKEKKTQFGLKLAAAVQDSYSKCCEKPISGTDIMVSAWIVVSI